MEEIKSSISIEIPFVKVYLGDIENLIKILERENPDKIILEAENKSFKFEEIEKLGVEKIKNLKINTRFHGDPFGIQISFDKYFVHIYSIDNTTLTYGISKKVEDYLKKKTRIFSFITKGTNQFSILGVLTPIASFFLILSFFKKYQSLYFVLIYAVVSFLFLFMIYICFYYKNIIFLKRKKECQNFFIRNRDQLLVNLIIGIFVAIISFLLGRFSVK